jgi:hypothetical protein
MYYAYTKSAYFTYSKTAYFYLRRNCLVLAIPKLLILLIPKTLSFSYTKTAYFLAIPKLASFSCTKTIHFLHIRTDYSTCTIIGYRLHYTVRTLQTRHLLSVLVRPWLQYSNIIVTFFDSIRLIIAILIIVITRYSVYLSQISRIVVVIVLLSLSYYRA